MAGKPFIKSIDLQKSGEGYKLVIEGGDHTIGNLLSYALRGVKGVEFAYYEKPHPLEERIIVFFKPSKGADPGKVLERALRDIIRLNETFKRQFLRDLGGKGVDIEA